MMDELAQSIDLLETWLKIESTSGQEAAFLEALELHFSELGFRCERLEVEAERWNLLVRREAAPRLVFSTHVDTVPPFFGPRRAAENTGPADTPNRDQARIYGRGACDTKGGIVAMAKAGERLLAEGIEEFGYLFVVGEEVDHCGAKHAGQDARLKRLGVEQILLCEPTENQIVSAQKGMVKCRLTSEGIAGHSAFPGRGESAVEHLLDALNRLRAHDWPEDSLLGPTTFNIGTLSGGVAANVFAPQAHAELLFRCVSDTEAIISEIKKLAAPSAALSEVVHNDPVFFNPPENFKTCTVPFNTDATYLGPLAPIWLVGPGNIQHAHSAHEHITHQSLADGIELYHALARLVLD